MLVLTLKPLILLPFGSWGQLLRPLVLYYYILLYYILLYSVMQLWSCHLQTNQIWLCHSMCLSIIFCYILLCSCGHVIYRQIKFGCITPCVIVLYFVIQFTILFTMFYPIFYRQIKLLPDLYISNLKILTCLFQSHPVCYLS